jgi:RNA polymerase sigma-70 factor (ECF subfamily)
VPSLEQGDPGRAVIADGIEPARLDAVYRAEAPRLIRVLKRRVWAEDERHDIVQEAFTRLAETRSAAASLNPAAYLQGIVRHLLADRTRRWFRSQSMGTADIRTCDEPLSPDAAAEINQMRERYRAAVDLLPPKTREVYVLHRVEDLAYKQIADRCGISVRTVEWHVAQAIMRISKSISADGR